ncbi:transporter substrate-binding domain-containing protein [Sphaerotilus mobilis]|uniref:Amino acid ABC transporter substrate-binding protein (PAAT family) n=1 Tax=Sphaerotilus mobilis TaxID=47994 RepID=A0A4Q7LQU7_9BURK|nr:transporter substrate-binding domain-containing protein [Sphaerotilus mobilis]RZS57064.1 amino acid ABC transporter substrate-binding protein (PAAT family) [Sphaerotilus mobilis]
MLNRPVTWLLLTLLAGTLLALMLVWHGQPDPQVRAGGMPLRVGYAVEPPYIELDEHGRVGGESAEVLRATLRALGEPEPVWVPVPFFRLIHQLEMDRIDVIAAGLFITPERSRRVDFSRPTLAVGAALLVRRGNPDRVRHLSDFTSDNDLRLAVLDGAVEARLARGHGIPTRATVGVAEIDEALALLRRGEVAAFALSAPSLRRLASRETDLEVIELPDLDPDRDLGLPAYAWRRGDPRLPAFDAALGQYLGSPAHLQKVRPLGFTPAEVSQARRHVDAARRAVALGRDVPGAASAAASALTGPGDGLEEGQP